MASETKDGTLNTHPNFEAASELSSDQKSNKQSNEILASIDLTGETLDFDVVDVQDFTVRDVPPGDEEDIFVSAETLKSHRETEAYVIEPTESVDGVSSGTLLGVKFSYDRNLPGENKIRRHRLFGVRVNGVMQRVWQTEPIEGYETGPALVAKPGLGEIVEDGIGWQMHKHLTRRLPGALVLSHASHGVGPSADNRGWAGNGIQDMSEQGLKLLEAYLPSMRVILLGTSMGTIIINELAELNIDQDKPVEIAAIVDYAPAIVDPSRLVRDMYLRFGPQLGVNALLHVATQSFRMTPKKFMKELASLWASKPSLGDAPALGHQIWDIMHGVPEAKLEKILENYRVLGIMGTKGAVEQFEMWERLEQIYPNLSLYPVWGKSHEIAIDPRRGAKKIAASLNSSGIYPDDRQHAEAA